MKKTIIRLFAAALLLSGLSACSDFLNREPVDKFSAPSYFSTETELEMYANGMVQSYLPDYTETAGGDAYNDLIATKTSTEFFRADVVWDNNKQGGWSSGNWAFLRRVNFMINNMERAKNNVSEEIYNHYLGVARFWRAYNYMGKIKSFSNVPWVEKYLQPSDTTILYGKRDDREYVFHKMTEDLLFACEHVMAGKFHTDGRINADRYMVNAFASRIFLYEGTFRKNIPYNPATHENWTNQYETADQLLRYAANAAQVVIEEGGFKLIANYPDLFISTTLQKDEVIWGRSFSAELAMRHSLTRYFHSSTLGQQYSGTKDLVHMFLKTDGTPVETDKVSILKEFEGRDPRLSATVLGPGHKVAMAGKQSDEYIDFTWTKTGYEICKWSIPDANHWQNSIDDNSIPVMRYAEVLLNYAEAKNELGEMDETVWNLTVGALRQRAGVANIVPGSAAYQRDTWLADYYSKDLLHPATLNDYALEIRRERVTELTFESELRQNDCFRYGQADLITRRYNNKGWAGIYLTAEDYANGFTFASTDYTFISPDKDGSNNTTNYPVRPESEAKNGDWFLSEGDHGYLIYKYDLQWDDKKYVRPIPQNATVINPALGQNYGW